MSFAYDDGDGRRVKQMVEGGTTTYYVYDAQGQLAAEYGGTSTSVGTQYLTADHLGSIRLVRNAAGELARYDYLPFGETISMDAASSRRDLVSKYEAQSQTSLRFTGKQRDGETGLDYFRARYYSGAQGELYESGPAGLAP